MITVAIDTRHAMTGQVFLSPAAFLFSMFFSKIVKYFDKMILVLISFLINASNYPKFKMSFALKPESQTRELVKAFDVKTLMLETE